MHLRSIEALACPSCGHRLQADDADAQHCTTGVLRCSTCAVAFPVAHGFMLADKARLDDGSMTAQVVAQRADKWFRDAAAYEAFLREKAERSVYDAYAMFQPFNESLRALLAVIEPIREALAPGDLILDTWNRTGWPGGWLASLFPEQHVISLWEGDSNVLGYSGFAYWLGPGRRRPNWDVVFTHPDHPLPFATDAFAFVHAYESLHRYRQSSFLAQAHRVARPGAPILFSHIHLTNSEPDPWFERGCVQHHGTLYRSVFDKRHEDGSRKAFVFGERTMFESGERYTVHDLPNTDDYNAAILVGDPSWEGRTLRTEHHPPVTDDSFLIVNPLLDIDLGRATVGWSREGAHGQVGHILDRHPCYEARIEGLREATLSGRQPQILYYARQGAGRALTFAEIAARLGGDREALRAEATELATREIVWPATVGRSMAQLQHYFGTMELPSEHAESFAALWSGLAERYGDRPIIETEDGTEMTAEVVQQLVAATSGWLLRDTTLGDRVLLHAPNCPEAYLVIWACWLTGRVIVPVEPDLSVEAVESIIERTKPALAFGTQALSVPTYQLDSLAREDLDRPPFSEGIADFLEADPPELPAEDPTADAAILFTSGSTGRPKGVRLSLGALASSGKALAEHFEWVPGDRLYSGGASYSMSGLRNPALGALHGGVTIVLPDPGPMNPVRAYALLRRQRVSVVTTVPTQLNLWISMRSRLESEPRPTTLRSIATTGYGLSDAVREQIAAWLDVQVTGYYGLTETCGLCMADPLGQRPPGNIGYPVQALAQVADADGRVLPDGERGELRICSPRTMSGYLEPDTVSAVRLDGGWLHTGDAAIRQPDGSIELVGRFDDQIKDRFGSTVFPSEVEGVAAEVPGVTDCCCLAIEDTGGAASLALFMVPAESGDTQPLQAATLAAIDDQLGVRKRPARIVFCEAIARRTSGKVDRSAMLKSAGLSP